MGLQWGNMEIIEPTSMMWMMIWYVLIVRYALQMVIFMGKELMIL